MRGGAHLRTILAAAIAAAALGGCVQVRLAQDKPIDINLNVTIKQEVLVRLQKDVEDLVRNNPGVF